MHLWPVDKATGMHNEGSSGVLKTPEIEVLPTCITGYTNDTNIDGAISVCRNPIHQFRRGLHFDQIRCQGSVGQRVSPRQINIYNLFFPVYKDYRGNGNYAISRDFAKYQDKLLWRDRVVGVFKDGVTLFSTNYSWLKPLFEELNYVHVEITGERASELSGVRGQAQRAESSTITRVIPRGEWVTPVIPPEWPRIDGGTSIRSTRDRIRSGGRGSITGTIAGETEPV